MLYAGQRTTVPHSRYGNWIHIMENMHWTWQELMDAPADLVDELETRYAAQAKAESDAQKKREREKRRGRR